MSLGKGKLGNEIYMHIKMSKTFAMFRVSQKASTNFKRYPKQANFLEETIISIHLLTQKQRVHHSQLNLHFCS